MNYIKGGLVFLVIGLFFVVGDLVILSDTGPLTIFGKKGVPPFPKFGQRGYPIFPNLVKGGTPFSQLWEKMATSLPKFGLKMVISKEVSLFFHIFKKRLGTIQVSCDNFIGREG